ncbi:MAG: NADPH-dependent F420 reductase [Pseudomonadota bacterium]
MAQDRPTLAIIGGTGALGLGLAMRWAGAGYPVIIGSRSREKAQTAVREIKPGNGAPPVRGDDNANAARAGDIVVIAVPFSNNAAILEEIRDCVAGKIVVDAVVPLVPPRVSLVQLPAQGSAAQIAQALLGESVRVVSAFHHVGAAKLRSGGAVDCDVLVFGNDREARDAVIALAAAIVTRGIDGGPIANSVAAEALTSVLIGINRRYKVDGAGIRITGIPGGAAGAIPTA